MQYNREVINELNNLSVQVFGTKSKWKKMIELGVCEPVMEDTKKMTIKDGKEVFETVKTQKTHTGPSGAELSLHTMHYYTVDSVKEFMLMVLDRRQQVNQAIKRIEAQKKAEEANKQTMQQASGTAV